jgi:hypothetical protein
MFSWLFKVLQFSHFWEYYAPAFVSVVFSNELRALRARFEQLGHGKFKPFFP